MMMAGGFWRLRPGRLRAESFSLNGREVDGHAGCRISGVVISALRGPERNRNLILFPGGRTSPKIQVSMREEE